MKIGVFGSTQSAHYLTQYFDRHEKTSRVFHFHGGTSAKFSQGLTKYKPISMRDKLAMSMATKQCDLIISTGLTLQLNPNFQAWLEKYQGHKLIPNLYCSQYEDSKIKSKALFKQLGIRTPDYQVVAYQELLTKFDQLPRPFVVKYDQDFRLGRQTLIVNDSNWLDILKELQQHGGRKFISAQPNKEFIIEQYVIGTEHSLHILAKGLDWCYLGSARDYKRELDQDQGNNVTSMGCYSPAGKLSKDIENYVDQLLTYFHNQGQAYHGIMYLGILCDTSGHDWLLELNCRPGNPELITVLDNISEDVLELLCADTLGRRSVRVKPTVSVCVQLHDQVDVYSRQPRQEMILGPVPDHIRVHYADHQGLMPQCGLTVEAATLDQAHHELYQYINTAAVSAKYRTDIGLWL